MQDTVRDSRPASAEEEEIALRDIFLALTRRKWIISGCVIAITSLGLLYAVFSTPLYTATVTVSPASDEGGSLSGLSSQLGGVAALAGLNFGGGSSDREEYLAILRSRELGNEFIERYHLKPKLFPDRWDADTGKWRVSEPGLIGRALRDLSRGLASLSGDEGWRETEDPIPTDGDAYKIFDGDIRKVEEDSQTGIVTVSFEFRNPDLAAQWANAYVGLANDEIRQRTIEETSKALEYLDNQVTQTTVTGLRDTIYSLVENQLEKIMLANAQNEFAFRVVDKAVVPEDRSHPKRGMVVALSLMLGIMLGTSVALALAAWRGTLVNQTD